MMHLDHVVLRQGSRAATSAKYALHLYDEQTQFTIVAPTNSRRHDDIVQRLYHYEGPHPDQLSRRW